MKKRENMQEIIKIFPHLLVTRLHHVKKMKAVKPRELLYFEQMCQNVTTTAQDGTSLMCQMPEVLLPSAIESILVNEDGEISDPHGPGVTRYRTNDTTLDLFLYLSSLNNVNSFPVDKGVKLEFYINTVRLCPPTIKMSTDSSSTRYLSLQVRISIKIV
jgi:hypothetical protein